MAATALMEASPEVRDAIRKVAEGGSLTEGEAHSVMCRVMDGEATAAQIGALLMALRAKGETVDEITGFARAMREHATRVRPDAVGYVDTCGTGGDGRDTFNISTVAAFVVAGAGVPVAKHGNRSVSSACGSADVLEALGVRIDITPGEMARCVDECGVGFLFAQALHPSMRHAAGPRREMGVRTVFNVLGPLTNPAGAKRQLLGVFDAGLAPVMAEVAGRLGAEKVLVVHGEPGLDEVSVCGQTTICVWDGGEVTCSTVAPEDLGLRRREIEELRGGDPKTNARIAMSVLDGEEGAAREAVLANAAAALVAAGAAESLAHGVEVAARSIDSGEAKARLDALRQMTGAMEGE